MSVPKKQYWLAIASVFCALVLAVPANSNVLPALSYDPVRDFSAGSNPNGAWSYGWTSAVTTGNVLNLYADIDSFSVAGMSAWHGPTPYTGGPPFIAHNDTDAAVCAHSYCVAPDELQLVPGFGATRTVLRWTAPIAGLHSRR